jgi:hypothetical protein
VRRRASRLGRKCLMGMARPARFELTTSVFGGLWFACRGSYFAVLLMRDGMERNEKTSRDYADILRMLSDVVLVRFRGKADMQRGVAPTAWVANGPRLGTAAGARSLVGAQ